MLAHREQLVLPLQLGQGGTDALDPDIRLDAAGAAARALPAVPEEGGVAPLAGGVADPAQQLAVDDHAGADPGAEVDGEEVAVPTTRTEPQDRKSTRLNSSHVAISYAVFCL